MELKVFTKNSGSFHKMIRNDDSRKKNVFFFVCTYSLNQHIRVHKIHLNTLTHKIIIIINKRTVKCNRVLVYFIIHRFMFHLIAVIIVILWLFNEQNDRSPVHITMYTH